MKTRLSFTVTLAVLILTVTINPISAAESTKDQYQLGYKQFKSGQYNIAIKTFNSVIEQDHNYFEAYWGRGFASAKLGQFANAVNEFSRYLAFRDDYGNYGDQKPFDMNYQDDCEKAANIFSGYLKTNKKWFLYGGRAVSYMKLKEIDKAKADLDEMLKTMPQDQSVLVASAYAMRGNCNLALGHADAAVADYSKGLDARQLMPIFRARALAYKKLGKNELAAKDEGNAKTAASDRSAQMLFMGGLGKLSGGK